MSARETRGELQFLAARPTSWFVMPRTFDPAYNPSSTTASVAYRGLVKTRRGKSTLLLFTTGQIAQLVPLRAFTTDERARVLAFLPPDQKAIGSTPWKRVVVLWVVLVAAFLAIWLFLNSETPNESATHPRGVHNDR